LLQYGKDYPAGYDFFRRGLRKAFLKNSSTDKQEEIDKLIDRGNFVIKELEALYMLRKYRFIKRNYYDTNNEQSNEETIIKRITEKTK
jgi:hypothetical protein